MALAWFAPPCQAGLVLLMDGKSTDKIGFPYHPGEKIFPSLLLSTKKD